MRKRENANRNSRTVLFQRKTENEKFGDHIMNAKKAKALRREANRQAPDFKRAADRLYKRAKAIYRKERAR